MSAVETIDVAAVAPDSIEVVESFRTWDLSGGKLVSHNGVVWKPGEALHAECKSGSTFGYRWMLTRGEGVSLDKAIVRTDEYNAPPPQIAGSSNYWYGGSYKPYLAPPNVEPAPGFGYTLVPVAHETPHEHCTCGIYSGTTLDICPAGTVRGKVKLWGKLIPGERGYRAECAYPSEFIVPASLADDPTLLAFGVPITVDDSAPAPSVGGLQQFDISTNVAMSNWALDEPHEPLGVVGLRSIKLVGGLKVV